MISSEERAVLAGGCFWGVQGVFQHVDGVASAVSGYAGGDQATANYGAVSTGATGQAESVRITFDPRRISYGRILQIYFSVAHDPTQLDYQGPDTGTQYRSGIYVTTPAQRKAYIDEVLRQVAVLPVVGPEHPHVEPGRVQPLDPAGDHPQRQVDRNGLVGAALSRQHRAGVDRVGPEQAERDVRDHAGNGAGLRRAASNQEVSRDRPC